MQAIRLTIRIVAAVALLGAAGGTAAPATAAREPAAPLFAAPSALHCDGGLAFELAIAALATAP